MDFTLDIKSFNGYVHYYINNEFLGMLIFDKGELSDFRAIIRKNKQSINKDNLHKILRLSLFELLNHFIRQRLFIQEPKEIETIKSNTVKKAEDKLLKTSKHIIDNNLI